MVRREAVGRRVPADPRDPHRAPLSDQQAEQAVSGRGVADRGALVVGHANRDELGDHAVRPQHAERAVPRVGDLDRQFHDALQHGVQTELGGERQPGADQLFPTVLHGRSVASGGIGRELAIGLGSAT